jgi:hypothetical protein
MCLFDVSQPTIMSPARKSQPTVRVRHRVTMFAARVYYTDKCLGHATDRGRRGRVLIYLADRCPIWLLRHTRRSSAATRRVLEIQSPVYPLLRDRAKAMWILRLRKGKL